MLNKLESLKREERGERRDKLTKVKIPKYQQSIILKSLTATGAKLYAKDAKHSEFKFLRLLPFNNLKYQQSKILIIQKHNKIHDFINK